MTRRRFSFRTGRRKCISMISQAERATLPLQQFAWSAGIRRLSSGMEWPTLRPPAQRDSRFERGASRRTSTATAHNCSGPSVPAGCELIVAPRPIADQHAKSDRNGLKKSDAAVRNACLVVAPMDDWTRTCTESGRRSTERTTAHVLSPAISSINSRAPAQ